MGSAYGFAYSEYGNEWDGFVSGLIATDKSRYNKDDGNCLVLLGALTPTTIEDGAVTSGFNAPNVDLIAGGRLIDDEVNECDTSAIEAAGYGWILDAEVTEGTTYPFYAEFFLPGDSAADIEVIVVGDPSGSDSLYYEPTILDTIPTPETEPTQSATNGREILPVGSAYGFAYSEYGNEWDGFVSGLIATDKSRYNKDDGNCLVLLGALTPTTIEDGAVTSGFNAPNVDLIAGGRLIDDEVNECDTSAIEAAGYGWILDAEVTEGTTYPFYAEFFLPGDSAADIEVIVVGDPSGSDSLYYEPTILDTIPTP